MSNLLKKLDEIVNESEKYTRQAIFKGEIIDNIEELSKEIHYLKDKAKILINSNDKEELADTIFKLRDLKASINNRKQQWEKLLPSRDKIIKIETVKAFDMLKSTAEKLEFFLKNAA